MQLASDLPILEVFILLCDALYVQWNSRGHFVGSVHFHLYLSAR